MEINIPIEIGDPVVVIDYNQHDGYFLSYKGFAYGDIPNYGKSIFRTAKEAKEKIVEKDKK